MRTALYLAQKWEKVWDEVKYCSDRCRSERKRTGNAAGGRRMSTVLFWFRNDLRLHDQPALCAALTSGATHLLPVVCLPAPDERTPWGFARVGAHRRAFTAAALRGLQGR